LRVYASPRSPTRHSQQSHNDLAVIEPMAVTSIDDDALFLRSTPQI
jgi:hypothetical protein